MATPFDAEVMRLFEQALALPPDQRDAWLDAQPVPPEVAERARRLVRVEQAECRSMDETAIAPDAVPPEFPKVGDRLGSYELLKPLEAGGMGVVYLGRRADDAYDQQVAIKLVRPVHLLAASGLRRQLIARFEEERSILARMNHPNVARILDGGSTAGGIPYLVMEFVDGVSLTDFCKDRALDVNARLALFCKVCDGVQEAHRHLIVHRDLKPDNILVGENGEPRLLDFGIAKILEQEPAGQRDGTSLSAMTPVYASPEQVRQQTLTTSSDVYSLGVVLYQLLAGVRPYELGGLRPAEAEHVVCETLPDPMHRKLERAAITDADRRRRRRQITPDVERIVAKAMHKEADRRYGSAQELADDIRRCLAGQPVQAHPDSTGYRVRKFVRRHRLGVVAASVALAGILAASGVALHQARQARQAAADMAEVNTFLMYVLKYSSPFDSGGDPTLSEAIDAASGLVDKQFAGRPELSAPIRFTLGYSMADRNNLALAEENLLKALEEHTQVSGPGALATLEVREAIAQLRRNQGRADESGEMLRAVVADLEAHGHQREHLYHVALNNLGRYHLEDEDYAEALRYFRAAGDAADAGTDELTPGARSILVANLASATHGLGDAEAADELFREALDQLGAAYPEGSIEAAQALNNRAFVLDDLGRPDEAFALRQQSVAMRRRIFNGDQPLLVTPLTDLALEHIKRGEYDQSLALSGEAIAMARRVYPGPHPHTVMALNVQGIALLNSGQFLAAGEIIVQAETALAALVDPPAHVGDTVVGLRQALCKRPRTPPVPSCAGIEPTEPAET
jgi:serine/threonine-protein kinase